MRKTPNRKRGKKPSARRVLRDARGRRWTRDRELVTCFSRDARLTDLERRIASLAVPKMSRLHTSHWLAGGIERAVARTGCEPRQAIDVLERMQRWAHREEWVSQVDVALQLCGLELLRRQRGAEPTTIDLPAPLRPLELPERELLGVVAQWEAQSYAAGLLRPGDSEMDVECVVGAALTLVGHLADVDGVPVRVGRLEPGALAVELMEEPPELGPPPDGWVAFTLTWVAELYDRLLDRRLVEAQVHGSLTTQLRSLAMATAQGRPSHAA